MVPLRSINIPSPHSIQSKFVACLFILMLLPINAQAQADLGTLFYETQDGAKPIQDNGGDEGKTVWEVNLTGAPSGAVIKGVDIEYWITHPWVGDLKVWLTTENKGEWINYVLWNREGESSHDIYEKETGLTTWNGLIANRKWYLCAADYVRFDQGQIDSWKIWVYFDNAAIGVVPQPMPYYEDFTGGKPDCSEGWEYYSNNEGRIEIVDGKLRMDNKQDSYPYSLNEAILHVDLLGRSGVMLSLEHVSSNDENTSLPSRFTCHLNGDGIAISNDGTNWYLVTDLTSSFDGQSFDLDAAVQAAGITYTSDFCIKFQQYDNFSWSTDGRAFDNISITATGADPLLRKPFGVWKGTFNSTNYRVIGNIYDWIMREDYTTQARWELTVVPGTGLKINPSGAFSFNPESDGLSFFYTGLATVLTDGQIMEVPCMLDVRGTAFRGRIEGTYSLRLSPLNLPPILDSGTWQVVKVPNVALHTYGIEISTGWNFNDPEIWSDSTYDFSLGLETDSTVNYVEFKTPLGNTFQIPNDSHTQVGNIETCHYPVGTTSEDITTAASLVAYWTMDDNAANTTVTDSSGRGNYGIARRNTSFLSSSGKINGALTFNGSSDYIDCGNNSSLNLTDNFTIAAWIKPRSLSWLAGIVSKYHSPNANSYFLRLNRNSPYNKLEFGGKGLEFVTSLSALGTDQWYFVIGMRDSGIGKIYINGNLDASAPVSISSSADSVYIGMDYGDHGDARYFNGEIDNVMILNRTLSEAEISALYAGQQPIWSSREHWEYKGKFTDSDELDEYSDGIYQITVYYKDSTRDQTTVRFGIPGTANSIPQPTTQPVLTFPKHNGSTTSPVTFKWNLCNDQNANSVGLRLENQYTDENVDIQPLTGATSSDPIQLSSGTWQAKIFCTNLYDTNNADGIDVSVGKYSESDYIFDIFDGGLVAYWTMDDNASNTTVTDSSGRGNHGIARRNTSVLSTSGKINSALSFNGSSDYIDCGNNSSLNLTDNFTIVAWIKPRSFSWLAGIVSKYHNPNANSYFLRLNRDSPYNKLEFGGQSYVTSLSTLKADQWYFVIGMRDSGIGKIYINGNFDTSSSVSILSSADPVYIGVDFKVDPRYFDGAIDNVMIFNRTLSEAEISTMYNNGLGQ